MCYNSSGFLFVFKRKCAFWKEIGNNWFPQYKRNEVIGTADIINKILKALSWIFSLISKMYVTRPYFSLLGCFAKRKFPEAKKQHKYAIMVAARNEAGVIGNLLESIHAQDYPQELVDVFVVADNCDDNTAEVARSHGAVCYERFDDQHRTKGFALQFLVEQIRRDYGIEHYEAYFVFDADNLLKKDYITRMNESFDAGEKIVTSYRNTKNFDDNWIAASYGIHWLRSARFEHRARAVLRLAARVQGTGFMFASEVIKDGWNYTGFTEDRAFAADAVALGYRISYNDEAEFFDEQPVDMKIAMRQRVRWAKGHLQAVVETGPKLFAHIFVTGGVANRDTAPDAGIGIRFLKNIWLRLTSFDMFSVVFPSGLLSFIRRFVVYCLKCGLIIISVSYFNEKLLPYFLGSAFKLFGYPVISTLLRYTFGYFNLQLFTTRRMWALVLFTLFSFFNWMVRWLEKFFTAVFVFTLERKRIMHIKWYKKLWFCLMFPVFDIIGNISSCIALVTHVEWKPIPHTSSKTIAELEKTK